MARFRYLRQNRYNKLRETLLPFEAYALSRLKTSHAPYIKGLLRDRRDIIKSIAKQGQYMGWSDARIYREYRQVVYYEYREKGWMRGGAPDIWEMLRYYREKAIDSGEYYPRRQKKRKRYDERDRRIDKGNVKEQKRRWRERQKR